MYGTKRGNILLNMNEKAITDARERLERRQDYTQELFQDERQQLTLKEENTYNDTDVTKSYEQVKLKKKTSQRAQIKSIDLIKLIELEQIWVLFDLYNSV